TATLECARTEKHGVVNRSTGPGRNPADRRLQLGDLIRKCRDLRDVLIERENRQPVARAQNLADKVGGGFLLEADFLVSAHAGIDHDRQIQRLRSFRLELVDLLLNAFFEKLESFSG